MNKRRLKKFFSVYGPYKRILAADIGCSMLVAVTALIIPLCVRHITNNILAGEMDNVYRDIGLTGLMILALIVIQSGAMLFYDYRGHEMGAMMERDLRQELFDKIQQLNFSFFDNEKTGALMSRITNDLLAMAELYHHGPEDVVIYITKFVGAIAILFMIDVKLSLIILVFIPFMIIYTLVFNKKLKFSYSKNLKNIAEVNAQVEDSIEGVRVVQSFTGESHESEKFRRVNDFYLKSRSRIYRDEAYLWVGMDACMQVLTACVAVFGGIFIARESMNLSDLITFILYTAYLVEPIPKLTNIMRLFQEGTTGFARFMEIMEMKPEIEDSRNAIQLKNVRGEVVFSDVSFRYQEEQAHVLKNINMEVKRGDYVAIVGASGAGKTTMCSLIPRFYEADSGKITIDGIDIREIKLSSLRRNIAMVQQDVYLFDTTVRENIAYGNFEADIEEIIAASKKADAHEFIMNLSAGYDTVVGQRGVKLSGGQKQRIGIARAFLKNPAILIFDEATSSLDSETEKSVQSSLDELAENRTTFVIAHRLSTIKNAKRILVLAEDEIVEQGTHEELMAKGGEYKNLYRAYQK